MGRAPVPPPLWAAVTAAQKATQLQEAANKVIWATYNHLGVQLFISNLKPTLRDELMKAPPTDLNAAIKAARQLEKIRIRDPGQTSLICDNTFSDPGSGMEENPDPGKTSRIRNNELHIYGFKKKMLTHRSPKRFRPLTSWNSLYCSSRAQTASSTPEKKKWNLH